MKKVTKIEIFMLVIILGMITAVGFFSSLRKKVLESNIVISEFNKDYDLHFPDKVNIRKYAPNRFFWTKKHYYKIEGVIEGYYCIFYINKGDIDSKNIQYDEQNLKINENDITIKLYGADNDIQKYIDFNYQYHGIEISGRIYTEYRGVKFDNQLLSEIQKIFEKISN